MYRTTTPQLKSEKNRQNHEALSPVTKALTKITKAKIKERKQQEQQQNSGTAEQGQRVFFQTASKSHPPLRFYILRERVLAKEFN